MLQSPSTPFPEGSKTPSLLPQPHAVSAPSSLHRDWGDRTWTPGWSYTHCSIIDAVEELHSCCRNSREICHQFQCPLRGSGEISHLTTERARQASLPSYCHSSSPTAHWGNCSEPHRLWTRPDSSLGWPPLFWKGDPRNPPKLRMPA